MGDTGVWAAHNQSFDAACHDAINTVDNAAVIYVKQRKELEGGVGCVLITRVLGLDAAG